MLSTSHDRQREYLDFLDANRWWEFAVTFARLPVT
jgi:hypothetical protein